MTSNSERQYPNLIACQVKLQSSAVSFQKPPVRLPDGCLETLGRYSALPEPYDFGLENQIVSSVSEREQNQSLADVTTRSEIQRHLVVKMKSVTDADESICISLLESHSYDLKTSIEAYFSAN